MQGEEQRESQKKTDLVPRLLTPSQIGTYSGAVMHGLRQGLPSMANDEAAIARVLADIMSGAVQCWVLTMDRNLVGMMTTMVHNEPFTLKPTLLILSIYAADVVGPEAWPPVYEFFAEHARSKGCSKMLGFSSIPEAIRLAESLGWDSSQRVLVKEV